MPISKDKQAKFWTKPLRRTKVISIEEKAFREALVACGRGTVRLEGLEPSEEFEALNRRYIAGDIIFEEHGAAVARLQGR